MKTDGRPAWEFFLFFFLSVYNFSVSVRLVGPILLDDVHDDVVYILFM